MSRVLTVEGVITLDDNSQSEFSISLGTPKEWRWHQWGATTPRRGQTVSVVEVLQQALIDLDNEPEDEVT
jgi:hypothetical protein